MDQQIKGIYDQHAQRGRQRLTNGREEEGPQLKEHIVRINGREINDMGRNGHHEARDRRNEEIRRLLRVRISMITAEQHRKGAEHQRAMIDQCMEACERKAGIVTKDIGGIDEIDKSTQKSKGTDIAAGSLAHDPLAPNSKGHCVHKDAAGIKRQYAAPLKANYFTAQGFPKDLRDLKNHQKCPKRGKYDL